MENITHTLVGATLARAGLSKKAPLAAPALLLAANLPDIDIFGWLIGQNYLDFHRGITHAVAGSVALSAGQAAVFHGINLWRARKSPLRPSFCWMWVVCLAGILSNPALDFLNDFGLRPWMPFDGRWYYGDLLGITDPWVWIVFGSALFVGTCSRRGQAGWLALGVLMLMFLSVSRGIAFAALWTAVLLTAVAVGRLVRRRGLNEALAALGLFAAYVAALLAVRESVAMRARESVPGLIAGKIEKIEVLPGRPAAPHRWMVVVESSDSYHIADVGLRDWRTHTPSFERFEKNLDDDCYRASLSQQEIAALARFARFPSASVEASGDSCIVWLRDLRYARKNEPTWGTARATLPHPSP